MSVESMKQAMLHDFLSIAICCAATSSEEWDEWTIRVQQRFVGCHL